MNTVFVLGIAVIVFIIMAFSSLIAVLMVVASKEIAVIVFIIMALCFLIAVLMVAALKEDKEEQKEAEGKQ